ncbi:hypothetical protein [Maliponia aquimaris]|uniref:hypothetical protein n=1 Tax=Maliponia aquimaris TaxID=1673631 RepID=UPI001FE4374F|nr:hypothetical protein [Maliponia aquimaris]
MTWPTRRAGGPFLGRCRLAAIGSAIKRANEPVGTLDRGPGRLRSLPQGEVPDDMTLMLGEVATPRR